MKLVPPDGSTRVMRRRKGENLPATRWHIWKAEQVTACGRVLWDVESLEYSTVSEIRGGLCPVCWPWVVDLTPCPSPTGEGLGRGLRKRIKNV